MFGELTRSTSAPCSARVRPFVGPARMRVRSSTRTESSGPAIPPTGSGSDSPILSISTRGERPDSSTLRVSGPLLARAHHRPARLRLRERVLERLRVPLHDRSRDCRGVGALTDAEHPSGRIGEARERAVQMHRPFVAAFVERDQRVVGDPLRRLRVEQPLEDEAQQRRARPPRVDRDRLLRTGLVAPDERRRGRDRAESHGGRRRDGERARVDRIAALDRDRVSRVVPDPDLGEELGNPGIGHESTVERAVSSDATGTSRAATRPPRRGARARRSHAA